jgi:hypothetical protein
MSTISCFSTAVCRFFILVFGFLFYGPDLWVKDMNIVSDFQSRGNGLDVDILLMFGKWLLVPPEEVCINKSIL